MWYPALQAIPHAVPSQIAEPFSGAGHGEHALPHVAADVLDTHAPLQLWKLALHIHVQAPPAHIAVPFAGAAGHAAQELPHDAADPFDTHAPLQL